MDDRRGELGMRVPSGVPRETGRYDVMIVGAGGVAHVAAHKAAMANDVLGDICIASRTQAKCE